MLSFTGPARHAGAVTQQAGVRREEYLGAEPSNSLSVVRVKDAAGNPVAAPFVLATLTDNGLNSPRAAAFDGERVLVINIEGESVSLFRALDTLPLGSVGLMVLGGVKPYGVCSDGLNFWITTDANRLVRF